MLSCLALSARSVVIRFAQVGARYHLAAPLPWRLIGPAPQGGVSDRVVICLDDLEPDADYQLLTEGAELRFRTPACPGQTILAALDPLEAAAADNAARISAAIAVLPEGGTLTLPRHRFFAAPIALRSAMTLHLPAGAEIHAPAARANWPILPPFDATGRMLGSWEGLPDACFHAPISAIRARDLILSGPGVIDGGGARGDWWQWPKATRDGARRPRGLHLIGCENVTLMGFTIRNAASWTIHPQGCKALAAYGLTIEAPANSPNTDGFNPESCEDIRIEGTAFSVGDDCIAIKAGKRGPGGEASHLAPSRRITIRNCKMADGHGGVVIGSEMSGSVEDVHVSDCEMTGTDRGLRLKTRRGRGGAIRNIRFERVSMADVGTAISANAHYNCDADGRSNAVQSRAPAAITDATPLIDGIHIADIQITGLRHAACALLGLPERPITNVRISGMSVRYDPAAAPGLPVMAEHIQPMRHAGLVTEHAELTCDALDGVCLDPRPITAPEGAPA